MVIATLRSLLVSWGLPGTAQSYLGITVLALLGVILIEPNPWFQRSVRRMLFTGTLLALLKWVATLATLLSLLLLPYPRLRALILGTLAICGGLTLVREWWWRISSGDRSYSSYVGGFFVTVQTVSVLLLAASILAALIEAVIAPARVLESDIQLIDAVRGWIEVLATILALVTLYYVGFAALRRILGVTGFSWADPPNWRTLFPHLKYTLALRWGWPPVQESELADVIRIAYIRQIVGSTAIDDVVAAAQIKPVATPELGFTCAVLGDPGEGDRSQLGANVTLPVLMQAVDLVDADSPTPGFLIICSDIVYPAGELMDYERTVYRPDRVPPGAVPPLIYGLPGNHDWYNNLKGMLLNFGYPAATTSDDYLNATRWKRGMRTGPWARYGFPWGWVRWLEVGGLRSFYNLHGLGGDPARSATQQRLPFMEFDFGPVPLCILAVDTGCVGSVDAVQQVWLRDRLQAARAKHKLIVVLLSEPLYVNGEFAEGAHLRDIYTLLRAYEVDVIIGGDTHTYQHYMVQTTQPSGHVHSAHHFVNGGAGAYLSPPIDLRWQAALPLRPSELVWVYQDADAGIDDRVELLEYYPTADQLRQKFAIANTTGLRRRLRRLEANLLGRGLTNVLDHDRPPLFQSFLSLTMLSTPVGWTLRITPWFTSGPNSALQAQPPINIAARDVHVHPESKP